MWTWGGKFVGYREGDYLWRGSTGECIGTFDGDEVYGKDGRYRGEVMSDDRLIRNPAKSGWIRSPTPSFGRRGSIALADYAGYAMYAGYEDFPLD
jgi:hypothetical protein